MGVLEIAKMPPLKWTREMLSGLSARELRLLCGLCGISYSRTKKKQVDWILTCVRVRLALSMFGGGPTEEDSVNREAAVKIAEYYTSTQLRKMAKDVKQFQGYSKLMTAISLLKWRNECRRRGQIVEKQLMDYLKTKPRQMRLFN